MENETSELIIVANRLPIDICTDENGNTSYQGSPGGLVTALESVLHKRDAVWVGWPGISDFKLEPFKIDDLQLVPVELSSEDYEKYYEGFSNAVLWPQYHDTIVKPDYRRSWWDAYVKVNQKFADTVAKIAKPQATVWVQDYQLQLVPEMLRQQRPDLKIGFFMHIPFPSMEIFLQLPWRNEILHGLLGCDLIGFQTKGGATNFLQLAKKILNKSVSKNSVGIRNKFAYIEHDKRKIKVGAFPISIDSAKADKQANTAAIRKQAKQLRKELGNPKIIMLGIDRLDYTKGIDVRLNALTELLKEHRLDPNDIAMIQIATPSRERVDDYKRMRNLIEMKVGHINGVFGSVGKPIVHYIHKHIPREELISYYYAADIMLVTPFRDGMNLVAKEYIAAKHDLSGALILSEFAGAAQELTKAYLINPYDIEGVKNSIMQAIEDSPLKKRARMRALRRQVLTRDVTLWANSFLEEI